MGWGNGEGTSLNLVYFKVWPVFLFKECVPYVNASMLQGAAGSIGRSTSLAATFPQSRYLWIHKSSSLSQDHQYGPGIAMASLDDEIH